MKVTTNIKKILILSLVLFSFAFVVHISDAACRNQKSFLWRVTSDENTVYVLGSLHAMRQEDYPLHKSIEDAFGQSDVLAVEANINDISQLDLEILLEKAFYPEDESLEGHVSEDTYKAIKEETGRLGLPLMLVNRQKPWFLALSITSMELLKLGFSPVNGIDMHFMTLAEGKKKIIELESVEYQINLLSGFSDDEQEAFLRYSLKELNTIEQEMGSVVEAWKNGDTESMESLMAKNVPGDIDTSTVLEELIYKRNRNMLGKIEGYLEDDKTYFVIVGAGHLVGNKGIINLLKEKGYTVEQI